MSLLEIREILESWRVNTKEENNEHIDVLCQIVDHLIRIDQQSQGVKDG